MAEGQAENEKELKLTLPHSGGVKYLVSEPVGLVFLGLDKNLHTIHGCPLPRLRELAGMMDILWQEINSCLSTNQDITVHEIYHQNLLFEQGCLKVLDLCGIPASAVDINMLAQMLFPFTYKEGDKEAIVDGLIMQLNFPSRASPAHKAAKARAITSKEISQGWNDLLASLWVSTKNLKDAVEVSNAMPWNQLAPTIISRNQAYGDPEEKENQAIMENYAQAMISKKPNLDVDFDPDDPDSAFKEFTGM